MGYDSIIQDILADHPEIKFTDCRESDCATIFGMDYESFERDSWNIGGNEIVLGLYRGEEDIRLAAFAHEVGHSLTDSFSNEAEAWARGFQLLAEYGIEPTLDVIGYRDRCLRSHESAREADRRSRG